MYFDGVGPFCHSGELPNIQTIEVAAWKAMVRGEQPIEAASIPVESRAEWECPQPVFLPVCGADLAEGIVNLRNNPPALAEWARFILATSGFFVIEDECSDYGDRLLACIWDFAFGAPPADPAITLANTVRNRFRNT